MKRRNKSLDLEVQLGDLEETSFNSTFLSNESTTHSLAGKIECLQMTNFMCHSNLEIKFNSRVNFITGRNGSGKSAIMAALIIVLGGPASLTDRASGVLDFVKKGESWAKVSITLNNEGANSFKEDVYGARIVISRSISSSGRHGYVCSTGEGCVVSRKKEEVDEIVGALNLQIENPICVLNQDVARSFLCTTDSSVKFSMFMKATQLEELKRIYLRTLDLLQATREELSEKQKGMEEAKEEVRQLKQKIELFVSLEKRVAEREELKKEYLWALVAEEEAEVRRLRAEREELLEKRAECERGAAELEERVVRVEEEVRECERRVEEGKCEVRKHAEEKARLRQEVVSLQRQIDKAESQVKGLEGRRERMSEELRGLSEHLEEESESGGSKEAEKQRAKAKVGALQERLSAIREEMERGQRELRAAEEGRCEGERRVERLKAEVVEAEEEERRLGAVLSKAKGRSRYLEYGSFCRELAEAIEREGSSFHRKPIGPCGMHVRLTGDAKWARAVESVVGGLMSAYRCDNAKDFQVLKRIMERVCGKTHPTVIIGKFLRSRHEVESRKVSVRGFETVLDVLSFDNDVVFNTFVDQVRIETILLFETDAQAASMLTNVQNVPKNLRMGLTLQSDVYFPAPRYRTYHGHPEKGVRYLAPVSKGAEAVRRVEEELKGARRVLSERASALGLEREGLRRAEGEAEGWRREMSRLRHEEGRVQVELSQARDVVETQPVVKTRVALSEELEQSRRRWEEAAQRAAEGVRGLEGLRGRMEEAVGRAREAGEAEERAEGRVREWERRAEEKREERGGVVGRRGGARGEAEALGARVGRVEEEVERRGRAAEERARGAREVCGERVETERSPGEVQRQLQRCERYLKASEKLTGSLESTRAEYERKKEVYGKMKRKERVVRETMESLVAAAAEKKQKLNAFERHTSHFVSMYFQAMLRTRGYDGAVEVDFEAKALELKVKSKEAQMARKDSKTLSGGERSYSMVSFILAIWKVVEMPVYFLDEFDVFMDKVNRKVIMDLLLEHANSHSNKQFVFITPLDISSIQPSDAISVFKLPDPLRKDGTTDPPSALPTSSPDTHPLT